MQLFYNYVVGILLNSVNILNTSIRDMVLSGTLCQL